MTVTLEELNRQAEEVQRRMDTISNLLKLAAMSDRITELQTIKLHMEQVGLEINKESEKLSDMMKEFKEEKRKMRVTTKALLVVVLMLLLAFTVSAQDAPLATNTPDAAAILPVVATVDGVPVEATLVAPDAQPPVVVVENPQSTAMFWIFSAVIFALLAAFVLVFRPLIIKLAESAPAWAVEAAFSAGGTLLKSAQDYASSTPSVIDDDLVAELRKEIERLKQQVDEGRRGITITPSGPTHGSPPEAFMFPADGVG